MSSTTPTIAKSCEHHTLPQCRIAAIRYHSTAYCLGPHAISVPHSIPARTIRYLCTAHRLAPCQCWAPHAPPSTRICQQHHTLQRVADIAGKLHHRLWYRTMIAQHTRVQPRGNAMSVPDTE
eukprot:3938706-Rhodomonas_salina.2